MTTRVTVNLGDIESMTDDVCTRAIPKALASQGHDWPAESGLGVILGVTRCRYCGVTARTVHFPALAERSQKP